MNAQNNSKPKRMEIQIDFCMVSFDPNWPKTFYFKIWYLFRHEVYQIKAQDNSKETEIEGQLTDLCMISLDLNCPHTKFKPYLIKIRNFERFRFRISWRQETFWWGPAIDLQRFWGILLSCAFFWYKHAYQFLKIKVWGHKRSCRGLMTSMFSIQPFNKNLLSCAFIWSTSCQFK